MKIKRPGLLLFSIFISLLVFFVLLTIFRTVADSLTSRFAEDQYITPTAMDSLYMHTLQDTTLRTEAIRISQATRPLYILADSLHKVLKTDLSEDIIKDIILQKGMVDDFKHELLRLDTLNWPCPSPCLHPKWIEGAAWKTYFQNHSPSEIQSFIEGYEKQIEHGEFIQLRELTPNSEN